MGAAHLVSLLDANGAIEFQSAAVERALGYATADVVGTSALEYVHADDRWKARQAFGVALLSRGPADPVDLRVRRRDGSWHWVEAVAQEVAGGVLVTLRV